MNDAQYQVAYPYRGHCIRVATGDLEQILDCIYSLAGDLETYAVIVHQLKVGENCVISGGTCNMLVMRVA